MKRISVAAVFILLGFSIMADEVFYLDHLGNPQYFKVVKSDKADEWPTIEFEGSRPMKLNGTMGIVFKGNIVHRLREKLFKDHGLKVIYHDKTDPDYYLVSMKPGTEPFRLSVALFNSGSVEWAQPDFTAHFEVATDVDTEFPDEDTVDEIPEAVVPDDTWYSTYSTGKWHHEKIRSNIAWALEQGDPEIKIAIVDNGVDLEHEDLIDNILPDLGWNFVDEKSDASFKFHTTATAYQARIVLSHGTSVAGIAAAKGNNGKGIAGICWNCGIIPVRFIDTDIGSGYVDTFHKTYLALKWAVDKGASVINNSWVWWNQTTCNVVPFNSFVEQAVKYAVKNGRDGKGSILVWAAGNNFCDTANIKNFDNDNIVVVSALRHNTLDNLRGYKSIYSNYGDAIDVIAPAGDPDDSPPYAGLVATDISMGLGGDAGNYATNPPFAGTSAAAPVVSGAIALMLSAKPEMKYFEALHCLKKAAANGVEQRILDGDIVPDHNIIDSDRNVVGQCEWKDIKDPYFNVTMQHNSCFGYGYLDVYEMVQMAVNDECSYEEPVCEKDEDCPEDQFCDTESGLCVLELGCKTDEDCLTYQKCDVESGLCYFEESGDTGNTGDTSDTGDSGNSGNSGDSVDTSDSGDSADTGNSGDSGNSGQIDDTDENISDNGSMDENDNDQMFFEDEEVGCGCTLIY